MTWVKCPRDGHVWNTTSTLIKVTCPSCHYKMDLKANTIDPSEMMEHFNLNENGVRVLDKSLATENSPNGMIIDVFFKNKKAWCEYDDSSNCKHVEYALTIPVVQEILKQKGWKIK